jgi:peptide/nickel transport system substrate-binding protein
MPYVDGLVTMAGNATGFIMAREFEESPESINKMMGTGPFIWVDAQPPVSITLRKNPTYYLKPYPYFDEIQLLATTDPVARITNFTTKQVHMPWLVYAQDRDTIKQQRPDARIQEYLSWPQSIFMRTDKPPFNDKRVRQALSMTIDRKKIRDGVNKGEGRDDQYFNLIYKNLFGTREVSELGEAAKYWRYDPQAAKQLLAAAGVPLPIQTQMYQWDASVVGQWKVDMATLTQAGWRELGIADVKDIQQTGGQFLNGPNLGQYDGMGHAITTGLNTQAPAYALAIRDKWYRGPNGERPPLNNGYVNDPQLSALADKQVRQLDRQERTKTLRQMEEIIAEQQYVIVYSSTTQSWLWDPSLRNVRLSVEQGSKRYMMKWWFA